MNKTISALLGLVLLAACAPASPGSTPSPTATSTAIPIPTWLAYLPAGMVAVLNEDGSWGAESVASSAPGERLPMTAERVKNVSPSFEIGLDGAGNITGLPEGKTQDEKDAVKGFYQAIQKKFPTLKVYYNQDTNPQEGSGHWILFAVDSGGKLIYSTSSYGTADAPEQPSDYPIIYSADGISLVGTYTKFDVPGGGIPGVTWTGLRENRLPQFLANEVSVGGDKYYTEALNYKAYVEDGNYWEEVAGVAELLPTPEVLDKLPAGYTIANGQLVNESGVSLGAIKSQNGKDFQLVFAISDDDNVSHDYTADITALKIHSTGALLIDGGERTGFVWKGDRWAEVLLQIKFETDGMKFSEFPSVTLEDIASGRLAEAEHLAAAPLSEKAVPFTYDIGTNGGDYWIHPDRTPTQRAAYLTDEAARPVRYEFFYNTEINGVPLVVSTLQIKNPDNSVRFLHTVRRSKFYTDDYLQEMPMFNLAISDDPNASCDQISITETGKQVVCPLNQPDSQILMPLAQEMVQTGIIPEKFEEIVFQGGSILW